MPERTLLLIKPDGVERRLVGEIISRIERKGLTVAALELRIVSDDLARQHYAEHDGKPFFGSLLEFITSGPLVAAIVEGPRAVAAVRQLGGRHRPGREGHARHHPRRLRSRNAVQPGARLRFAGVGRARDRALVPPGLACRQRRLDSGRRTWSEPARSMWDTDRPGERRRTGLDVDRRPNEDFDKRDHRDPRCGADRPAIIQTGTECVRLEPLGARPSQVREKVTRAHSEALAWPRRKDAPGGLRRIRDRRWPILRGFRRLGAARGPARPVEGSFPGAGPGDDEQAGARRADRARRPDPQCSFHRGRVDAVRVRDLLASDRPPRWSTAPVAATEAGAAPRRTNPSRG